MFALDDMGLVGCEVVSSKVEGDDDGGVVGEGDDSGGWVRRWRVMVRLLYGRLQRWRMH